MQRSGGKGGYIIYRILYKRFCRPLRLSLRPLSDLKIDLFGLEAHPAGHCPEKCQTLRHSVQSVNYLSVQQFEIRRRFHIKSGRSIDYFIEKQAHSLIYRIFFSAALFSALNYINVVIFPDPVHICYNLGRVLKIAVHKHAGVAGGYLQTCKYSAFLTEIPAKINGDYILSAFCHSGYFIPGLITRAVVNKDKLELYPVFF